MSDSDWVFPLPTASVLTAVAISSSIRPAAAGQLASLMRGFVKGPQHPLEPILPAHRPLGAPQETHGSPWMDPPGHRDRSGAGPATGDERWLVVGSSMSSGLPRCRE